jgi:hypothetical protein
MTPATPNLFRFLSKRRRDGLRDERHTEVTFSPGVVPLIIVLIIVLLGACGFISWDGVVQAIVLATVGPG